MFQNETRSKFSKIFYRLQKASLLDIYLNIFL